MPAFNADSAYYFVKTQVAFGPRVPNTPAHDSCAAWLTKKLQGYADEVKVQETQVQTYDNRLLNIKNIIASFHPDRKRRILLCAHWDTRHIADQDKIDQDKPIPGANDGGSGVGVLLEIARQLKIEKPNIGIDIILFDAEDQGPPSSNLLGKENTWCLGSQHWAKHPHEKNYMAQYGILLDMVGAQNATFTMEGVSMIYAKHIVRKIWNTAAGIGYSHYFVFDQTPPITDDHLYLNELTGIPTIDIIHHDYTTPTYFGNFWHTHNDNMDIIDKNTLKAVGQTILTVIFEEQTT